MTLKRFFALAALNIPTRLCNLSRARSLTLGKYASYDQQNYQHQRLRMQYFCTSRTSGATRKAKKQKDDYVFDFNQEARNMLRQVVVAVKPLEKLNPNFKVQKVTEEFIDGDILLVTTQRGDFKFFARPEDGHLIFQSYISGINKYAFDIESKCWLSVRDDHHDFRGMVIREFLRHCTGCPQFP